MKIEVIYEVSRSMSKESNVFSTLYYARQYAMELLKTDVKAYESIFIHQMIYVDGVFENDERIDFYFKHPYDGGIEWCFRREKDEPTQFYDFFLKEKSDD